MNESVITVILSAVEIIISVALIVVILMQSKNASGLTGALGGMGQSNTYWDKNKGRSLEGKLTKYTKILATLFIIFALVISFLPTMFSGTEEIQNTPSSEFNNIDGSDTGEAEDNVVAPESESSLAAPENNAAAENNVAEPENAGEQNT